MNRQKLIEYLKK